MLAYHCMTMLVQLVEALNPSTLLVFLAVFLLSLWYMRRDRNLPPGPKGLPLVGSIPFVEKNIAKSALELSKRYGSDVITIRLGPVTGIFLNSYDVIKEALSSDLVTDRPADLFIRQCISGDKGIATTDGALWRKHRRFALSVLRDFGMGKMAAETKIQDETQHLVEAVRSRGGEQFNLMPLLRITASNVICSVIFGRRYAYTDTDFMKYMTEIEALMRVIGPENPMTMMPWLRHVPGDPFKFKQCMKNVKNIHRFEQNHIDEHTKNFDPNNIEDFLYAYMNEKREQDARNPDNTYTDIQLKNVVNDLFIAGTDTSSTTLLWGLMYLIKHQDIQEKVQKEIDDVIGRDRLITMPDKRHLPYTEAVIFETHRVASLVPLSLPHANNSRDVTFRGYRIPKGASVFPNLWAVHHDPNLWKHPEGFHPENFLDDEGKLSIPNFWIPFSTGRRQCIGESLAKMEIFLVMTSLLQKFSFSMPDGAPKPDVEGVNGIVVCPKPFELCAKWRG